MYCFIQFLLSQISAANLQLRGILTLSANIILQQNPLGEISPVLQDAILLH